MENSYAKVFDAIEKIAIDKNKEYEIRRYRRDLISLPKDFLPKEEKFAYGGEEFYSYVEKLYDSTKDKETHYIQIFKDGTMKLSVFYDTCLSYLYGLDGYYELYDGLDVFRFIHESTNELIQEIEKLI